MKKVAIALSAVLLIVACSPKTAPTITSTTNTTTNTTAYTSTNANTTMIEAGHTVYTNRCGRCHGLKEPSHYTAERWDGILKSMIPKAKLDETQAQQVTAYVMANAKDAK